MNSLNSLSIASPAAVATEAIRLFRVYSPFSPRSEVKVWAHNAQEADVKAREKSLTLKRARSLKALVA